MLWDDKQWLREGYIVFNDYKSFPHLGSIEMYVWGNSPETIQVDYRFRVIP